MRDRMVHMIQSEIGDTSETEFLSSLMAPRGTVRTASLVDTQHSSVVVIILGGQVINLCPQTEGGIN